MFVADSDISVALSIQFLLAAENISSVVFSDGIELINLALVDEPACIVAESKLPDMTGLFMMQKLVAVGINTPVILLTASDDIAAAVEAVKHGAWDYLEKPFMQHELLRSVTRAMALNANAQ
ncbi:MAG: response regulator transcription factor [Halioglobus sp.]